MILDTSFMIDLFRNKENAVNKAKELGAKNIALSTTTINIFELWQGSLDIKNKETKGKILEFLSSITIFPFDLESAKEAGTSYSDLRTKGMLIDPEDCMIASIAKTNNKILLTRNKKHFDRIAGLKIESY